jgi:CRP-like cAMP-binding protein
LAALPAAEYARLSPHLQAVPLEWKSMLHEAGEAIRHVYFPLAGVLSVVTPVQDGRMGVETGVVGREGMAGLGVFLGAENSPGRCIVQVAGKGLRMRSADFRDRVGPDSPLHGLLLRYTHAYLVQVSQAVACNSLHPVGQRLAGWLLRIRSRAGPGHFPLTHKLLATMLGVRRATVTEAAQELQSRGLIRYSRGQVTVRSRPGLEAAACGCHRVMQSALDRIAAG